jgi:hypothetical protein
MRSGSSLARLKTWCRSGPRPSWPAKLIARDFVYSLLPNSRQFVTRTRHHVHRRGNRPRRARGRDDLRKRACRWQFGQRVLVFSCLQRDVECTQTDQAYGHRARRFHHANQVLLHAYSKSATFAQRVSPDVNSRPARQAHGEDRALARLARHRHVAAHHAGELARQGEAKPGPAIAPCSQRIGLGEVLK